MVHVMNTADYIVVSVLGAVLLAVLVVDWCVRNR